MDVKIQALDRVLEALSPALAAELDRVVQETREALEQEFRIRLQSAVREAENTAESASSLRLEQAVEEAKVETRRQVTAELEEQFSEKLRSAGTQMKSEAADEMAKLQAELDRWRIFAETQRDLAEASSQPEMLSKFLLAAQTFAGGLAIYVAKADGLALWKSKGSGPFPDIISRETADPDAYFRIIAVRGKTVCAVCARPVVKADALDFLATSLERAIEVYGLKLRAPAVIAARPVKS